MNSLSFVWGMMIIGLVGIVIGTLTLNAPILTVFGLFFFGSIAIWWLGEAK